MGLLPGADVARAQADTDGQGPGQKWPKGSTTTFQARNNRRVTVDQALWSLAQSLISQRQDGRLAPSDAAALLAHTQRGERLELEKKTLRHIRWYFRWTEPGGKALLTLLRRAGQYRWSDEGIDIVIAELCEKFNAPPPKRPAPSPSSD